MGRVLEEEEGVHIAMKQSSKKNETFLIGPDSRWKFCTKDKIGHGSFGSIYLGEDQITKERVAVKVESSRTMHPQLAYESKVYKLFQKSTGVPNVYYFGKEANRNLLVMELCGPSLEQLFVRCGRRFTLPTVLILADQLLKRVEVFHSRGFLHRDVKPENFLLGKGELSRHVYMIDFGLAKKYYDNKSKRHLPYREDKKLTGTARYASVNTHAGCEQSRRDDLEALGYMLLYFLRGKLPWQGLSGDTKEKKYEAIYQCKRECSLEELCKDQPKEFLSYMRYCRSLSYEEVPNYSSLRKVFRDLWALNGYTHEDAFEWERVSEEQEGDEAKETVEEVEEKKDKPVAASKKDDQCVKTAEETEDARVAPVVDARIPVASSFVRKKK